MAIEFYSLARLAQFFARNQRFVNTGSNQKLGFSHRDDRASLPLHNNIYFCKLLCIDRKILTASRLYALGIKRYQASVLSGQRFRLLCSSRKYTNYQKKLLQKRYWAYFLNYFVRCVAVRLSLEFIASRQGHTLLPDIRYIRYTIRCRTSFYLTATTQNPAQFHRRAGVCHREDISTAGPTGKPGRRGPSSCRQVVALVLHHHFVGYLD